MAGTSPAGPALITASAADRPRPLGTGGHETIPSRQRFAARAGHPRLHPPASCGGERRGRSAAVGGIGHVIGIDADRWREAAQLRHDRSGWAIIWLAKAGEFRACKRPPGARQDTALAADTISDLTAQIAEVERAARAPGTNRV